MSTSIQSQNTTRMFARVVGPFLAVLCVTAAVQGPQLWTRVSDAANDPLWSWVAGAFTLLAGLVVIALHPYWRGVAAFSVSALGWLTAVKGLLLVAFPATVMSLPAEWMGAVTVWRVVYVAFALLGLYLAYVGWAPGTSGTEPREHRAKWDLPRAA
ncbi:hypothetical protein [Mycolicibacter senuensis]|uniref:hypothetical protein n=1 Tax=Mycolicibacter senuensis TaxID=386913 RepID=UPI000DCE1C69|nr:hypothetical protein [Mycolicibacter senuensis]RAV00483.1 hypothetical protein DQP56_09375 [Mycolicibacter senuensis]